MLTWLRAETLKKLEKKMAFLNKMRISDDFQTLLKKEGVSLSDEINDTFKTVDPAHPLPYVLMDIEMRLMQLNGCLTDPTLTADGVYDLMLGLKEIPMPLMRTFNRQEERYKIIGSACLSAYKRWERSGYIPATLESAYIEKQG